MPAIAVNMRNSEYDIRIDRKTEWGNPFRKEDVSPAEKHRVCTLYRDNYFWHTQLPFKLHELIGKRLGCHCAPRECHGDFLAKEANMLERMVKFNPGMSIVDARKMVNRTVKLYWKNRDNRKPVVQIGQLHAVTEEDESVVIQFVFVLPIMVTKIRRHFIPLHSVYGYEEIY